MLTFVDYILVISMCREVKVIEQGEFTLGLLIR